MEHKPVSISKFYGIVEEGFGQRGSVLLPEIRRCFNFDIYMTGSGVISPYKILLQTNIIEVNIRALKTRFHVQRSL